MNAKIQTLLTEQRLRSARALVAFCLLGATLFAAKLTDGAEAKEQVIHLLQGNDRTPFYSFLKDFGLNKDPDNVFSLTNGVLHISGQYYGYLAAKETNFANYKLVAEFKWGEKTLFAFQPLWFKSVLEPDCARCSLNCAEPTRQGPLWNYIIKI